MIRRLSLLVFLCTSLASAQEQEPWISQTGLTASLLNDRITRWAAAPFRLHVVNVSGYEENGVIHYSALWLRPADDDARRVLVGATAASLISANTTWQAQGYRLIWLNGFNFDGVDYYNAIYRQSNGSEQVLRVGDTLSAHQSADTTLSGQGYYLDNLCAFRSGLSIRYGAWWTSSRFVPQTDISYGLTGAEYQSEFNLRAGTWRLHNVCGYQTALNNQSRFTVIWRKPARTGAWAAMHGLSKANYLASQGNQTMVGRRPAFQQAWSSGTDVLFNGLWVDNGGLAGGWVDQLDQAVVNHMEANAIPGLTLAISRRGRLMFARGYGLADQEAGELAGPDHRFRVASVAKPITGVSVLHALENYPGPALNSRLFGAVGVFGGDYGTAPYSTREQGISIRGVLQHTAGWPNDGKLWWDTEPSWESDHKPIIDYQLNSVTQTSDPGTVGRYSNLGFVIAARVVEKVTGQTYENYTVNEVLAPCGISGATRMAVGERTRAEQKFMEAAYYTRPGNTYDPYLIDPRRMDGSTAWIAKPSDLLLLARRVDGNATHTDILNAASLDEMRTPASPNSWSGYNAETYGLGWYTDNINNPTFWGHNGSMSGTRAEFIVRMDGVSYAWMANAQLGNLNGIIEGWSADVTAASAWPDIDLFSTVHPNYDAWAASHFASLDRQPGLRSIYHGVEADPDDDGIPNGGEAYLGLDPLVSNPSPYTVAKVGTNLRIRWQRSTSERGIVANVQTSSDLKTWAIPIGVTIVDRPDLISQIGRTYQEVLIPITGTRRFVRMGYRGH